MNKLKTLALAITTFALAGSALGQVSLTDFSSTTVAFSDYSILGTNRGTDTSDSISNSQAGGVYQITDLTNAVASVASGSANGDAWSLTITNNTGGELDSIKFDYSLDIYKTNSTTSTDETWTASSSGSITPDVSSLNLFVPGTPALAGADAVSQSAQSVTLTGLSLADAASFTITWSDANDSGTDAMAGISALSVTAIPEPSTYAAIGGLLALGMVMYRRRKQKLAA